MYKRLHLNEVIQTIRLLHARIRERFPEAGLLKVCGELLRISENGKERIHWIARANYPLRLGVVAVMLVAVAMIWVSLHSVDIQVKTPSSSDVVQIVDAFLSSVVLIGGSIFFLVTLENRFKRSRALDALHELRAIAHVVDMHQLTKDPGAVLFPTKNTASSPVRDMDAFELRRYLDYCAEMLSLVGKMAALYSQRLPDPSIVSAANDIENLCASMSQKIWQKIQSIPS